MVFGPEQRKADQIKEAEEKLPVNRTDTAWADTVKLTLPALDFSRFDSISVNDDKSVGYNVGYKFGYL